MCIIYSLCADTFIDRWKFEPPDPVNTLYKASKSVCFNVTICFLYSAKVNSRIACYFLATTPLSKLQRWNMNVLFASGHHFSSIIYNLLNSHLSSTIWIGSCWAKIPWDNFWLRSKSLVLITCLATQHPPKFIDDAVWIVQEAVCESGNVSLISPFVLWTIFFFLHHASIIHLSCLFFSISPFKGHPDLNDLQWGSNPSRYLSILSVIP